MNTANTRVAEAEAIALERLIAIARDSESEHEARLAAEAIFAVRRHLPDPPEAAAVTSVAVPTAQPGQPLTTEELADLLAFLPNVKPKRFVTRHTPAYWRDALSRLRGGTSVPASDRSSPSSATGPPDTARRRVA